MIHPDTKLVAIGPTIGLGVVATKPIAAGTIVWVRDELDSRVSSTRLAQFTPSMWRTFRQSAYRDDLGTWTLCWDIARFVNHHCDYNCVGVPGGIEMASRDIEAGEQLTNDYAFFNLAADEEFECACSSLQCRRRVDSLRPERYLNAYDDAVKAALTELRPADQQPLWMLLDDEQADSLCAAALAVSPAGFPGRHLTSATEG